MDEKIESLNKILIEKFGKDFHTKLKPFRGPCYLLTNGKFLYFTRKLRYMSTFHGMERKYLTDINLCSALDLDVYAEKLWPYIDKNVVISLNDGFIRSEECVIRLPVLRPNDKQLSQLELWIDNLVTIPNFAGVVQVITDVGLHKFVLYNCKEVGSKHIIERIKMFYVNGELLP